MISANINVTGQIESDISAGLTILKNPARFSIYNNFVKDLKFIAENSNVTSIQDYSGNSRTLIAPVNGVDFDSVQYPTVAYLNYMGEEIAVLKTISTTTVKQVLVSSGWNADTPFQSATGFEIWLTIAFANTLSNQLEFLGLTDLTGGVVHAAIDVAARTRFEPIYYANDKYVRKLANPYFTVAAMGYSILRVVVTPTDVTSYLNGVLVGGSLTSSLPVDPAQFVTSLKYCLGANYQNYSLANFGAGPILPNIDASGYVYFGKHAISNGLLTDTEANDVAQSFLNSNE